MLKGQSQMIKTNKNNGERMIEKRDFVKKLYAGIFFIIGLCLILAVIYAIGMEKGFMQPKFQMKVLFKEVGGLSVGAPIRLSGVNVGTVGRIDFMETKIEGRGVAVTMNVFSRFRRQLERSEKIAIKTEGLLGGKLIEISTNQTGEIIDVSLPVFGKDPMDVQNIMTTFQSSASSLNETSQAIDSMIVELRSSSKTFKRILDRIEQRIIDGDLFKIF